MSRDRRGVRQYGRNGFHVVQFHLDGVATLVQQRLLEEVLPVGRA